MIHEFCHAIRTWTFSIITHSKIINFTNTLTVRYLPPSIGLSDVAPKSDKGYWRANSANFVMLRSTNQRVIPHVLNRQYKYFFWIKLTTSHSQVSSFPFGCTLTLLNIIKFTIYFDLFPLKIWKIGERNVTKWNDSVNILIDPPIIYWKNIALRTGSPGHM